VAPEPVALSPRELEVMELVAAGLTNEAIAEQLTLSVRTVERHLSNVYAKLRVSGRAGRAAAAVRFSETLRARRHATPGGMRAGTDGGAPGGP
jgi:DNA-binding NarL/FixJ family response regulator